MTHANQTDFATALAASVKLRLDTERKPYDSVDADKQRIIDNKCKKIGNWYKDVNNEHCIGVMFASGINADFLNSKGASNIYNAKKVFELAEFMAAQTVKLDNYDLVVFRTLLNFTLNAKACRREHLMQAIDGIERGLGSSDLVFRMVGFTKDEGTSKAQAPSSLANFKIYNMITEALDADTGKIMYSLNLESAATIAFAKRLNLKLELKAE